MYQMIIPFKENADIPESHLYAFRVCNSAGNWIWRQSFYQLKNELLEKYGHPCDYDLQVIKKTCYTCNGTGFFHDGNHCRNCDKGIYAIRKVVLKRYLLNGAIFHKPVGQLITEEPLKTVIISGNYESGWDDRTYKYVELDGKIVNTITGIIKHEPMELSPTWAYYYLLFHYNREYFHKRILSDVKSYHTRTQRKLKSLLDRFNPLKAYAEFLGVEKKELELIDDLPF